MADKDYLVKRIKFFGRSVSIVLQNLNGPCPLLAIANVLSLRNELKLPQDAGREVSQERLVTMVADRLLEASQAYERDAPSPEAAAHAAHAVAECFEVLPKLTTGVDVNVKFHSIHAFEPTREVAVFDLLGVPLVHGWLYDPEDAQTAAVFGNRSYNELVEVLLLGLGNAEVERLSSASALSLRAASGVGGGGGGGGGGSFSAASFYQHQAAAAAAATAATAAAAAAEAGGERQQPQCGLSPEQDRRQQAAAEPGAAPELPAPRLPALATKPAGAAEAGGADDEAIESVVGELIAGVAQETAPDTRIALGDSPTRARGVDRVAAYSSPPAASRLAHASAGAPAPPAAGPDLAAAQPPQPPPPPPPASSRTPSASAAARDAAVVRDFLEAHCSQLTPAGLAALASELRDHQLAVFFRNNHFSAAFKYEGRVYLLVTDQGYASEPDVVWERLDAVDGNTTLCTATFEEFAPHAEPPYDPEAFEAAAAAAAAERQQLLAAGGGGGGAGLEEADFALALQLQLAEEEAAQEERARREQERQQRAAAQAQAQQQQEQQQQQQPQQSRQQQQQSRHHRLSSGGGRRGDHAGRTTPQQQLRPVRDRVEDKCSIM
ncbi:hypothetical protein Rsub_02081 [Raphidocelis subcapitata]|uniref:MINDY deubiquitinase domain-containing protein n=1 Tax=Raphidocelis subcapitata TaxID=307507 RepID=A0A2V0NQF0_9CHLO|nr:hypothetical protein Rsub_02081 [Raphidocelis subcapitata]|eukprot:GBF89509.1 hypothetical protein Rsub_02081 [Raphidocelis subcapitata]